MDTAIIIMSSGVLAVAIISLSSFVLYPVVVWLVSRVFPYRAAADSQDPTDLPAVSLLVAVRNGQAHIGEKVRNAMALDYPEDKLEVVAGSDGSTDDTEAILRSLEGPRVHCLFSTRHDGKASMLNRGAERCRGEIIVLSDADARIEAGAIRRLVRHFEDPRVGGVCGQRRIGDERSDLAGAQSRYIGLDSTIKVLESRIGSITSNDGKLYAIRRELFQPIPSDVTDDLYTALAVVNQGYRFVFEPEAVAMIPVPSRSGGHELERRRRVVARSLRGLRAHARLLNPFRTGFYALGLFVNKVVRRLVPICLLLLVLGSIALGFVWPVAWILVIPPAGLLLAAAIHPIVGRAWPGSKLARLVSIPFYFGLGCWGTLMGVTDFLRGRSITKWEPRKTDDAGRGRARLAGMGEDA